MKRMISFLIILFLIVSCMPQSTSPSILSDQICGELCWNNIVVGKTNTQDVLRIVPTLSNVVQESITSYDNDNSIPFNSTISFRFYRTLQDKKSLVNVSALTRNNIVVFMTFQGDLGLTFQEVSDVFGEPDLVSSLWAFDGGVNVHFVNSIQGVEIFTGFDSEKSFVSGDTEVNYLTLFDPKLFQVFLENNLFSPDHKSFIMYSWVGYGKIEEHYWPPTK